MRIDEASILIEALRVVVFIEDSASRFLIGAMGGIVSLDRPS